MSWITDGNGHISPYEDGSGNPLSVAVDGNGRIPVDVGAIAGGTVNVGNTAPIAVSEGGTAAASIAAGAGTTIVKAGAGRLWRALVTAAGTGALTFYDSASAASGTVIGVVPASAAEGTVYALQMPAANGIVASNAANGQAVTVSYE